MLIRKYMRFGVEGSSGLAVCFDFLSVFFMIKEDTFFQALQKSSFIAAQLFI